MSQWYLQFKQNKTVRNDKDTFIVSGVGLAL